MALLHQRFCIKCNEETLHMDSKCSVCAVNETKTEVESWHALTIEQRVNNLRARVEELERGAIRYH